MFSDGRTPASGEQRAFKPHAPHFIPWLRNSLKPHHGSDLELNGPYKSKAEVRGGLTPLERAKGIGIFSIQGRDKAKKSELRCNGVGMARMLPVMLRGHHILPGGLGRQKEGSPARGKPPPEPDRDPGTRGPDVSPPKTNHGGQDGTATRKYGPLVGPPAVAVLAGEAECRVPVVVCMEDRRGKVWDYSNHTIRQRDLHSSSWVGSDAQGPAERQHGFTSSFSYIGRNSQSQRDLTAPREPPVEAPGSPLNGVIFSTEVPSRGLGYTTTLQGPRKRGAGAKHATAAAPGQSKTWVPQRSAGGAESHRNGASWNRKVVRNQIKRVVDNLEQVLTALRDVHQEMKEVVQQIDYLTSSIDLNDEDQLRAGGGDSSSSSSSSEVTVTVGGVHRRPSEPREQQPGTLGRDHRARAQSPPSVLLCPLTSERTQTLRFSCSLGLSTRQDGPPVNHLASAAFATRTNNPPQFPNVTAHNLSLSPQRILPVRPPTPGLSPLTVNLHQPNSPGSSPQSPGASSSVMVTPSSPLSPKRHPPPTLSPSVIIETPQIDHPSAAPLCPSLTRSPSASCPPADSETQDAPHAVRERRASSAGPTHRPSQLCAAAPAKPLVQGRRGRKPPPYPHHRLSDHTDTAKESRKAPPYPEKRRLLSTTV